MSITTLPQMLDSKRWSGMRIGLLGGSFNPPHEGHVHISLAAMQGLGLDAVWWLVTPQNPLKTEQAAPMSERMRLSEEITAPHPEIFVTNMEVHFGTVRTYDTVRAIKAHFPQTKFVWVSGMDTALTLHQWYRWQDLLKEICMVHLARNPRLHAIPNCPLRDAPGQKHVTLTEDGRYPLDPGTSYWMLEEKIINISSTEIREKQGLKGSE